ncbi:MAG: hypothetical protein ACOCYF_01955 [Bacteroidota bacterium]
METKQALLEDFEIKVKDLLSELYQTESKSLGEIKRLKERYNQEIESQNERVNRIRSNRRLLERKFGALKKANTEEDFVSREKEFMETLEKVEKDRETFITIVEERIRQIGLRIEDLEKQTEDFSATAKGEINNMVEMLKKDKDEMMLKLQEWHGDASKRWDEVKNWFSEKSMQVRENFRKKE